MDTTTSQKKKAALLKELESIREYLDPEDQEAEEGIPVLTDTVENSSSTQSGGGASYDPETVPDPASATDIANIQTSQNHKPTTTDFDTDLKTHSSTNLNTDLSLENTIVITTNVTASDESATELEVEPPILEQHSENNVSDRKDAEIQEELTLGGADEVGLLRNAYRLEIGEESGLEAVADLHESLRDDAPHNDTPREDIDDQALNSRLSTALEHAESNPEFSFETSSETTLETAIAAKTPPTVTQATVTQTTATQVTVTQAIEAKLDVSTELQLPTQSSLFDSAIDDMKQFNVSDSSPGIPNGLTSAPNLAEHSPVHSPVYSPVQSQNAEKTGDPRPSTERTKTVIDDEPLSKGQGENPFLPPHIRKQLGQHKSVNSNLQQLSKDTIAQSTLIKGSSERRHHELPAELTEDQIHTLVDQTIEEYLPKIEYSLRIKLHDHFSGKRE
ncbi:MAG: hypothetical protein ACI93R_003326 [Flavobacteriales bacterium]|jgi:hypothetical protein